MITKPSSRVLRRVPRAAAPPLLISGALLAVGDLSVRDDWMTTFEISRLLAAAVAGAWLTVATAMTVHRTRRDMHAHRRLQGLRDAAQTSGRALVHVEAVAWRSRAGQHTVVVNVATGYRYRLWLPEADLLDGAYAVIEQRVVGVVVLDWIGHRTVEAAHRHERRHPAQEDSVHVRPSGDFEDRDDARRLVEETEQFLRQY